MKPKLTKAGRNIMSWLKHWEISSQGMDKDIGGVFSPETKKDEKRVLCLLRRQVWSRYSKKG